MDYTWWVPYTPERLKTLLQNHTFSYWLAGGYALELFLGYDYRPHGDIDILIPRKDQHAFRETLPYLHFFAAHPPGKLRAWPMGEFLDKPIDDIWVKERLDGPFVFQIMLLETDGDQWVYKRDLTLRGALADFGLQTPDGTPIIAPEIQLVYKSKNIRDKDQLDFDTCLPKLSEKRQTWLLKALEKVHPEHPWIRKIRDIR